MEHAEKTLLKSVPECAGGVRINAIGLVVAQKGGALVLDDGTGQLDVRTFGQAPDELLGKAVLVIGPVRVHEASQYVVAEILRPVQEGWVEVRRAELGSDVARSTDDVLGLIRRHDDGTGASSEEVLRRLGKEGERKITRLLAEGEIYESRPGRLKVLD